MEWQVIFTYDGKQYSGILRMVGGANAYHLFMNDYYRGQLFRNDDGWIFATNKGYFPEIAMQLGEIVDGSEEQIIHG